MSPTRTKGRQKAVSALKRQLILDAARKVFEEEGLDGASLRAIASEAGYTPAALYFHFDSKEAIYSEVLKASLAALANAVAAASDGEDDPRKRLAACALAFFDFYAANPRDLDLGFYLFRGGMKPMGLGAMRNAQLNAALEDALAPIGAEAARLGLSESEAGRFVVGVFAHAVGLLLLTHTGRIRMFGVSARDEMLEFVASQLSAFACVQE